MNQVTLSNAAQQDFLPLIRALVRAYQGFTGSDARGLQATGLTAPQADVVFTLGNTEGMTFKEIGEHTLITKGTLTGVIDRLQGKGLVQRLEQRDDRRCTRVVLTAKGNRLFEKVFPQHIAFLKTRFDRLSGEDKQQATVLLNKIAAIF